MFLAKLRKYLKICREGQVKGVLTISVVALALISSNSVSIPSQDPAELDNLLTQAYNTGQVEITAIVSEREPFWQKLDTSLPVASFTGPKLPGNPNLTAEFILERFDTEEILKLSFQPDSQLVDQLRLKPVILEPNYVYGANSNLPAASYLRQIRLSTVPQTYQKLTLGPSKVKVAIIDSGFAYQDQYQERITDAWNLFTNSPIVTDENGHGTHLAGLVLALSPAELMPIQAMTPDNQVTLDRLLAAIEYAREHDADIINLSIGSTADSTILQKLLAETDEAGIIVVASAGNLGQPLVLNPAAYDSVTAIGALSSNNERAYYSNYGPEVRYSFNGDLMSLDSTKQSLLLKTGTSQATAAIAAILATVKTQLPDATNAELFELLKANGVIVSESQIGYQIDLESLASYFISEEQNK